MKITAAKFKAICITLVIIAVEVFCSVYLRTSNSLNSDEALKMASFICTVAFFIEMYVWIRLTNEVFSPYTVFFVVLFIFCCGQSIGWLFGLDMGHKDMWDRVDYGITRQLLLQGLMYSTIGISCFHLGSIIATKCDRNKIPFSKWTAEEIENSFSRIGKILLGICIPAFIANTFVSIITVMQGGYAEIYVYQQSSSFLMRFLNILANYYQPCLLLLLITYKNSLPKRRMIVVAMLLDVVINLFIGGRSGAVMSLLAIVLAYHYFVKPFSVKSTIVGAIGGYFSIAVLNAIADIRDVANKGLGDFLSALSSSFSNVIGEFLGELGWSITSVCWTMNIVPSSYPFRYGMSYLVSLISWIPSFCFTGAHPVVIWGELSNWLQNALGMTYGPGYTMVAEAYLNYADFGYFALIIEGIFVSLMIAQIPRRYSENNLLKSTFQIMVIMVLMKSLVRSSVSIAFRQIVFVIMPLYILVRLSIKKGKIDSENRNLDMA